MSRAALLVFAALLGGCPTAADGDLGSPSDSVAGTEARNERSPTTHAQDDPAQRSGMAGSLTAVATTSASEAQPCERVCGSLGDCLLADDDYTSAAAGGLELACLDLCVHSAATQPARAEFLACATRTECGQLQACAQRAWTALAAARKGPEVAGIAGAGSGSEDVCKQACRWVYACLTGAPPGEALLDPQMDQDMSTCVKSCEQDEAMDEMMTKLPGCLARHCSMEGVWYCFEEANR